MDRRLPFLASSSEASRSYLSPRRGDPHYPTCRLSEASQSGGKVGGSGSISSILSGRITRYERVQHGRKTVPVLSSRICTRCKVVRRHDLHLLRRPLDQLARHVTKTMQHDTKGRLGEARRRREILQRIASVGVSSQ
jgi:hypothetical protein